MNDSTAHPPAKDEHREKLDKRLTPLHLYKLTPKNNCGECGFASCLAFSTQAVTGQADIGLCLHLEREELDSFKAQLADQLQTGIGVKREGFEKALQFLRQEILKWDFQTVSASLGADCISACGKPALKLIYFGRKILVTAEDIVQCPSDEALDPYEKILIYNYVIGGAVDPAGVWAGMESLPNSVSKIKSLRAHCQAPLAQESAGKMERLPLVIDGIGRKLSLDAERVDFAAEFQILPKLSVRILWWDEDQREGFQAETKFLFDSRVLETLDLESLLFSCEQLTNRLMERLRA